LRGEKGSFGEQKYAGEYGKDMLLKRAEQKERKSLQRLDLFKEHKKVANHVLMGSL